jgi:TAP42-like family
MSQAVRKRRGQLPLHSDGNPADFDLIASLLPSPTRYKSSTAPDDDDEEPDSETDDILREATILLLRLCYAQAHSHLESMELELELLRTAPPSPPTSSQLRTDDWRGKARESNNDVWKLDAPRSSLGHDGKGPLLDSSGKVIVPHIFGRKLTLMDCSLFARLRFFPRELRTVHVSKGKCLGQDTICLPCPSTSTCRLNANEVIFSQEAGMSLIIVLCFYL